MAVDRALDTLASSMIATAKRQEVVANNIANVNTTGFRKDAVTFHSVMNAAQAGSSCVSSQGLDRDVYYQHMIVDAPVVVDAEYTSQSKGHLVLTNNPLDVAIAGDGYFSVQTPQGERYTRAGSFSINEAGYLVTQKGEAVLAEGGPVEVIGEQVNILSTGDVQVDGETVDVLRIVTAADPQRFSKTGNNMYQFLGENEELVGAEGVELQSGYLESSNVNTVEEINAMTVNMRAFEANSRAVKSIQKTLELAISTVGKAR